MTATVTKLPTARTSSIGIKKPGARWLVQLSTPIGAKSFRTTLAFAETEEAAYEYASVVAHQRQLPLTLRRAAP